MYGESLDFINVPIREDYDIVEDGYKEKLVDNFKINLGENENTSELNKEHNLTNVSRIIFNNSDSLINSKYKLCRKYNLLTLYNNKKEDYFSTYISGKKYLDGNIINPWKTGKKVLTTTSTKENILYNVTTSGTILIDTNREKIPNGICWFDLFNCGTENNDALFLPKGKYITNVAKIIYKYYDDMNTGLNTGNLIMQNYDKNNIYAKNFTGYKIITLEKDALITQV